MSLVFEITSDLAMFRKGYTTTSMVSYPFIPPTAVAGIIGAITGLDNGAGDIAYGARFWNEMKGTQVAITICSPISWYVTAVNLIKFKSGSGDMGEHIQPKHQFLKKPCYRIYIRNGEIYEKLKMRLKNDEFVFTPYLGVAYAIASVRYLGEFEDKEIDEYPVGVNSVVPLTGNLDIDVFKSRTIHKELIPLKQDIERTVLKSVPVLYNGRGKKGVVYVRKRGELELSKVGDDVVAWFEPW